MRITLAPAGLFLWEMSKVLFVLWVESKEGRTLPPYTAPGLGPTVKGRKHVAKGKWLNFDGTKWHGVTPTK
eukprot:12911036-Prorocentrum_lima.AAC.1